MGGIAGKSSSAKLGNAQGLFRAGEGVCLATVGLIGGTGTVQACWTAWNTVVSLSLKDTPSLQCWSLVTAMD